jgi:hypothetical protein
MDERQIGGDDLVRALERWAAEQRVVEAAASRAHERSLRDQAGASATWTGVLLDLAEQGAEVVLSVAAMRRSGRLVGVGPDYCILEQRSGRPAMLTMSAITSVTPAPSVGASVSPAGDRPPGLGLSLAAALGALADERTPVSLWAGPGENIDGDLIAAGQDVVTVRSATRTVHIPLRAVLMCELR